MSNARSQHGRRILEHESEEFKELREQYPDAVSLADPITGFQWQKNPDGTWTNTGKVQRGEHSGKYIQNSLDKNLADARALGEEIEDWDPEVKAQLEDTSDRRLFDIGKARQGVRSGELSRGAQADVLSQLLESSRPGLSQADTQGVYGANDQRAMAMRGQLQGSGANPANAVQALGGLGTSQYSQAHAASNQRALDALGDYGTLASRMRSAGFNEDFYRRNAVDDYNQNNIRYMRDVTRRNVDRTNRAREQTANNKRWKNHALDRNTGTTVELINQGGRQKLREMDIDAANTDRALGVGQSAVGSVSSYGGGS